MAGEWWSGIEMRHLVALDAVAREGSFRRAATRLGYVQSAISHQIAALEALIGKRLIDRSRGTRPLALTPAGEILLSHADALIARVRAAQADLAALDCETTVCSKNNIVSQRRALRDRSDLIFGSAHPQGGNTMSDDPDRGVVDSRFRVHGLTGISVIDASILPTNLFANCQATVMALGWVAADEIMAGHQ